MPPIIKLENLNFWYDKDKPTGLHALKNINLEIERGEYVAFFGPSGCGKTTLLHIIAGIDQTNEGRVLVNGRDITHFSKQELAVYRQIGVGIVFQQFNLIPSITVLDNVTLPMSFLGVNIKKRKEEGIKILERFGLKNLANRYPHGLSGGQQQRVGIARSLANNAPIIIADEPLGNLDSENAKNVLNYLKELNKKDGKTIIVVTHEAWSLKDVQKVFYMKDGAITKVEEVKKPQALVESLSTHFYKELTPTISQHELAAKSLSNLLLRGYTTEEIKRMEILLLQRFQKKITADQLKKFLDQPFKEGGVGLWRQKAERVAKYVEDVIEKRREISKIYKELEANPESPLRYELEKIKIWLLEGYHGKISFFQDIRLQEIIFQRIRNIIAPEHFRRILNLSLSKCGIGLKIRTAQRISEKMEAILQGETKI